VIPRLLPKGDVPRVVQATERCLEGKALTPADLAGDLGEHEPSRPKGGLLRGKRRQALSDHIGDRPSTCPHAATRASRSTCRSSPSWPWAPPAARSPEPSPERVLMQTLAGLYRITGHGPRLHPLSKGDRASNSPLDGSPPPR